MITLYTFGPHFGLPDASPFCMKTLTHFKMADVPYRLKTADLREAPKGKAPWIDDDNDIIADSALIRLHLEKKYGVNFDGTHDRRSLAVALAFERMAENQLYWAVVHDRWLDIENFERGPSGFFKAVPALMRDVVQTMVKRRIRRDVDAQGLGRHEDADRNALVLPCIDAIADQIGDGPYLLGDQPCGADASIFAIVATVLVDIFDTPLKDHAQTRPELLAYRDRMMAEYFPDLSATPAQPSVGSAEATGDADDTALADGGEEQQALSA